MNFLWLTIFKLFDKIKTNFLNAFLHVIIFIATSRINGENFVSFVNFVNFDHQMHHVRNT